jgi:hypothetical protein
VTRNLVRSRFIWIQGGGGGIDACQQSFSQSLMYIYHWYVTRNKNLQSWWEGRFAHCRVFSESQMLVHVAR